MLACINLDFRVIAVVGGLGAAVCWAVATLCSSRSSQMLGASTVVAWVMVVGLVAGLVPAILATPAERPEPSAIVLLVLTGLCNVTGLVFVYRGLRVGPVGIVAPITSTEGAIAALIAVLFGEALGLPAAVTLAMIAIGVVIAAIQQEAGLRASRSRSPGRWPSETRSQSRPSTMVPCDRSGHALRLFTESRPRRSSVSGCSALRPR